MMEPMIMKDEHHHPHHSTYPHNSWTDAGGQYSPHTQSPAVEYPSYTFPLPPHSAGTPMEPSLQYSTAPMYSSPHATQALYTPQWPSMLTNPPAHPHPMAAAHMHPVSTFSNPPILPRLTTHTSTSRRTLTDQDRRRMCQYHEDHPTVKQTEIGAMFGVERSTVSKVLRQKEKYLYSDEGSRSPIKKPKGKFPDIERALSNWARNHQRSGLALTDSLIREKARFFASTVGSTDLAKVNSTSWLEKFKQKNHLMGSKPRKGSDSSELSLDTSGSLGHVTPNGMSPISPAGYIPSALSHAQSAENLRSDSSDSYADFHGMYKQGQAQSATSLASSYTEITAPSSFSPTSPTSPFFPTDMKGTTSTSAPPIVAASAFPLPNSEIYNHNLPTPIDTYSNQGMTSVPQNEARILSSPAHSNPAVIFPPGNILTGSPPSQDEARKALELVMTFFQHQPSGVVDAEEYITMGKLMEKLKVQGSMGALPGGMHSMDLVQTQKEMSRKRSIQGLI